MTLTTSIAWLKRARAEQYAVGAFNANTMEQMQAIALAASAERAPVIIQISGNAARYIGAGNRTLGLRLVAEMGRVIAESVDVPVTLHLDHGEETEIYQALAVGFTSVMFDGSDLPFEENIAHTRVLCAAAHGVGACFEAELGEVPRAGVPGAPEGQLTDPDQVAEFVVSTGVDALAVSIGSVHALKQKETRLDFALLDAIHARVDVPLVLHGASGVLDDHIREGIRRGLCKVNVATQLNGVFSGALRGHLAQYPDEIDPRKYLGPARQAMQEQVRERMRLFGVSGKAAGWS
jgi:fructose-bisphosphate aldolase class II